MQLTQEGLDQFDKARDGGTMRLFLFRQSDIQRLARSRNPVAQAALGAIAQFLAESKGDDKPICLTCDTEFSEQQQPAAFVVNAPNTKEPSLALLTGICRECVRHSDDYLIDVYKKNLRQIYPDMQELS
jgi:hypothetical protein